MWINPLAIERNWQGGQIAISKVLYEFEGPVVFRGRVGFNDFLFAKRDEGDRFDFYLAVETNDEIILALEQGRLSLRGALFQEEGWLIESDLRTVNGYQLLGNEQLPDLLPANNVGLLRKFGIVPDTIEQADAFISFRFLGRAVRKGHVPLTVLQTKINQFSDFVRRALTPPSLHNGRDYRFFDVQMVEPRFSSLLLAARKPEFDFASMERMPRLRDVDQQQLLEEAGQRGRDFWQSLEFATGLIAQTGELSDDFIALHQDFLINLEGLVPSVLDGLDRVEITFNDGQFLRTALLDNNTGSRISDAQERLRQWDRRTINGVITEVNGDAGTFIIKDLAERQTTCNIPWATFERLDENGQLVRGRVVTITGDFVRRKRRDKIWSEEPIVFIN